MLEAWYTNSSKSECTPAVNNERNAVYSFGNPIVYKNALESANPSNRYIEKCANFLTSKVISLCLLGESSL